MSFVHSASPMPLHRKSELQTFLDSLGRGAKRTLSQNFLIDGNIVQKILNISGCKAGDTLIEIGPGPGVLTEAFVERGAHVVAIELDSDFAKNLSRFNDVTVIESDVLKVSLQECIARHFKEDAVVHIVSNVPYHITKELLLKIATECRHPTSSVLMVQEEVARKLTLDPISSSLLAMTLHMYGDFQYEASVSKTCFYPVPQVDSALLTFQSHPPRILDQKQREDFLSFLKLVYQQRRKALVGVLARSTSFSKEYLEDALEQMHLSKTARPDELSFEQWIHLVFGK